MKAATSASMMVMAIGEKVLPSPPPEATSGASLGSLPMSEAPNASLLTMIILKGESVEASGAGGFGGRGTGVSRAAAARFGRGWGAAFFQGARQRVGSGTGVSGSIDLGGRRIIQTKTP